MKKRADAIPKDKIRQFQRVHASFKELQTRLSQAQAGRDLKDLAIKTADLADAYTTYAKLHESVGRTQDARDFFGLTKEMYAFAGESAKKAGYTQGIYKYRSAARLSEEGMKRNAGPAPRSAAVASVIAIAGIVAGLFFLSPNMTGNAIANLSQNSSDLLGAFLMLVGFAGAFFWIKLR